MPAQETIDLFTGGAKLNRSQPMRRGNIVHLPGTGSAVVAGDLHGHRRNFGKIVRMADLANNPDRYVVLQEILHGGPEDDQGGCMSFELLEETLRYRQTFPQQVHMIMGNHDTAIINDFDVLKGGREMNQPLKAAMRRYFRGDYPAVMDQLRKYLLSQPLAVKCANRIWISHSLPAERFVDGFDTDIFERPIEPKDCIRAGGVYMLTWGRRHSQRALDKLAELLDVDTFIVGHQPQETGWEQAGKNLLIVASEHNQGCAVRFDLDRLYTAADLAGCVVPLASIE